MRRVVGLRQFITLQQDWNCGSSYGTLALICRTAEKAPHMDELTPNPTQGLTQDVIIISPQGNKRTRSILLLWFWFFKPLCWYYFIHLRRLHGIICSLSMFTVWTKIRAEVDKKGHAVLFFHLLLHIPHSAYMHDFWPGCCCIKMLHSGLATAEW